MRVHFLEHIPFEDSANIGRWARERGHEVSVTRLDKDEAFPETSDFDWLVIMGGLMNIYEYEDYPWLVREKEFIARSIDAGRMVIGVCLGAQLISHALGGKVIKNPNGREIGWHEVRLSEAAKESEFFDELDEKFTAFHWHGDTFSIPDGAVKLAESDATANQAFEYGDNVLAMQFHFDYSKESIEKMLTNCGDELDGSAYAQGSEQMRAGYGNIEKTNEILYNLLDKTAAKFSESEAA